MSRERFGSESRVTVAKSRRQLEKELENLHIRSPKKYGLMDLHEKSYSAEQASLPAAVPQTGPSFIARPRAYTADETFQLAKNWLLKKKQRRLSYKSTSDSIPPPAYDNFGSGLSDRSGSLSTLWSARGRPETVSLIVIGQPKSGKSELIGEIVDSWCENHENDSPLELGRSFSFDDESERIWIRTEDPDDGLCSWTKLRFVEIDHEKNDLWRTLSGSGFIITYAVQQSTMCLRNAEAVLTWLRMPAHNPMTPVWLVGTGAEHVDPEIRKHAQAEAKLLAHTFKCDWLEVSMANGHNGFVKNGHSGPWWTPRKLLSAILDRLVFSQEMGHAVISDRRGSDRILEEPAKLIVKEEILRKSSSHSCENLHTLAYEN